MSQPDLSQAKEIIKLYEGLRLKQYVCSAGKMTIGYGHTKGVKKGDTCTKAQAEKWLDEDIAEAYSQLSRVLKLSKLTENQINALVSFVFNLGVYKVQNSTLFRLIAFGDYNEAAKQFPRWVYATNPKTGKKEKLPGLVKRRETEMALFLKE